MVITIDRETLSENCVDLAGDQRRLHGASHTFSDGQTAFLPVPVSSLVESLAHRTHCGRLAVTSSMRLAALGTLGGNLDRRATELDALIAPPSPH
jgi:hypothetical protein